MHDLAQGQSIARNLRRHRLAAGLSQEELAVRAALGRSTILRIERGQSCQLGTLLKIAEVLGTPLSELMAESS